MGAGIDLGVADGIGSVLGVGVGLGMQAWVQAWERASVLPWGQVLVRECECESVCECEWGLVSTSK